MTESLIDPAQVEEIAQTENVNVEGESPETEKQQEALWYFADGLPGTGEKPEYLLPKFKTVADQAKSYIEAEKRLGGFKGAPEAYELALPEEISEKVSINAEDPLFQSFAATAKELNMSQDGFNKIVGVYAEKMAEQQKVNLEKELSELGEDAPQRIKTLTQWAMNNFDKSEFQTIAQIATSASAIKLLEKMRSKMTSTRIPENVDKENIAVPYEVRKSQLQQMVSDPRYKNDPGYRQQVDAEYERFYG